MNTPDIIGIGASTIDTFYPVDEFPSAEGICETDTSVVSGGGPVATALATASSLGSKTVMFDRVGDDWRADRILADLEKYGVDTSGIVRTADSESSGATALVRRRDGARAITFTRATCPELDPENIPAQLIARSKIVHLNGRHHEASLHACDVARNSGVKISFDGGANRYRPTLRPVVERSDILIVALDFAKCYTAEMTIDSMASYFLATTNAETVAITEGIRGSHIFHRSGDHFHQPAIPAKNVVDTTGCGDVYHGAFLHALARGQSLRESAALAADLASKTCEALGGRSALDMVRP